MDISRKSPSLSRGSNELANHKSSPSRSEVLVRDDAFEIPVYKSPVRYKKEPVCKPRDSKINQEATPCKESGHVWIEHETHPKIPIPTPRKRTSKPSISSHSSLLEESKVTSASLSRKSSLKSNRTSNISPVHELRDSDDETLLAKPQPAMAQSDGENLAVVIHRLSDPLIAKDSIILHPVVLVHLVDLETGDYLTDEYKNPVNPVLTSRFDVKTKKSFQPVWEELVMFAANYQLAMETSLLLLFEVLDAPQTSKAPDSSDSGPAEGWNKVAWGFLKFEKHKTKPRQLIGRKLRIQLFRVPRRLSKAHKLEIFSWWKSGLRNPFSSTLFVTVKNFCPTQPISPQLSSSLGASSSHSVKPNQPTVLPSSPVKWKRLPGQICKIPSRRKMVLDTTAGAMIVKFSPDGLKLACGLIGGKIAMYHVLTEQLTYLEGHMGHVYDIDWCDAALLSAGADDSVRLWQNESSLVLPHPAYVYGCRFISRNFVVTGCYDCALRLWSVGDGQSAKLISTYLEHISPINALCVCKNDQLVITGDYRGVLKAWKISQEKEECGLVFDKTWELLDTRGAVITSLCTDLRERTLIMRTKDSKIRVMDIKTGLVFSVLTEAENTRFRLMGSVTPCGSFVIAGDEDGVVRMWNLTSGTLAAIISTQSSVPVTATDYHPLDHVLAVASLLQVWIYDFDKNNQQTEGIVVLPTTVLTVADKASPSHSIKEKFMLEDNYPESRSKLAQIHVPRSSPSALQKLERIFAKLDVVLEWEQSTSNITSRASNREKIRPDSSNSTRSKSRASPVRVVETKPRQIVTVQADVHEISKVASHEPMKVKEMDNWDSEESC